MINPQPANRRRTPYGQARKPVQQATLPLNGRPIPATTVPSQVSAKKPKRWKRLLLVLLLFLTVGGSTYAYAMYSAIKRNVFLASASKRAAILSYDPNDINAKFNPSEFNYIGDGRFTMVLVGIDKAASLTDSIQVVSIDTLNKKSSITSIPRDLYVDIPGHGKNKINTVYKFGESNKKGNGSILLKEVVGKVLNTPVTNFALIDFSGLESLVDALGGIEVNVPKAINDPFFPEPNGIGYSPFSIKAGPQKLDGKTALRYARSRKTTSDFDRSERQQLVMDAIRKKALSAGVLSNPVKISNIIQSLGNSVKTDLSVEEIKTVFGIYNSIPEGGSKNYVLDTSSELGLLTSNSSTAAGYIAYPQAGMSNYIEVHRWYRKNNPDPLLLREQPSITVAGNGKATEKQLQEVVATLNDFGYKATLSKEKAIDRDTKNLTSTQLFQTRSGKSKAISNNYLANQFSTQSKEGNPLDSTTDFELVYVPRSSSLSSQSKTSPSPSPKSSPGSSTSRPTQ